MSYFYTDFSVRGNNVLLRAIKNDVDFMDKIPYVPKLYIPSNKESVYKTLFGENLQEVSTIRSISDARNFLKSVGDIENYKVYGFKRYDYQYISDEFPEEEVQFDLEKLNIFSIDIETTSEHGKINLQETPEKIILITIVEHNSKEVITFGLNSYEKESYELIEKYKKFKYVTCINEADLLRKFLNYWVKNYPHIVTGWNVLYFDIVYIYRRLLMCLGEEMANKLSPWGIIQMSEVDNNGKVDYEYTISGVQILDYLHLYKKFCLTTREYYGLDHIAEKELNHKKLDHSEFSTFREFYEKGWNKFVSYNIIDTILVDMMEDSLGFISLATAIAYSAKINYKDSLSTVRIWDTIVYNYLKHDNTFVQIKFNSTQRVKFEGGYVKPPLKGLLKWVISTDATSLYPHIIIQNRMSPETLVEDSTILKRLELLKSKL